MALSIKHPDAGGLARQLADITGESLTVAILQALQERLERIQAAMTRPSLLEEIQAIQDRIARLPVRDLRALDEILGYDEAGLPR